MEKYRIRFSKDGRAKFMSHLDLLRMFSRLARREDIDLEYSSGFNPHAEIVFSAPLPLGMTSDAEYVDLQLAGEVDENELLDKLARSLPEGIRPFKIRHLVPGEPNVMRNVEYCSYLISVRFGDERSREIFPESVKNCLSDENGIFTMKKSKSGTKYVDIRSMIREFGTEFDVVDGDECTFRAILAAGNENNLRPEVAFRGIIDKINGIDADNAAENDSIGRNDLPETAVFCDMLSARKLGYLDKNGNELW